MPPESAKLLRDMLDAADCIAAYTTGMALAEFLADRRLRDAVQWNFSIIGEARGQLHKADPGTAEQISEWNRIIAFRNQLIHGYGIIKHEITWDIVENKLPVLLRELRRLLAGG